MKQNGENLDTRMNEHGHTCSHQPSLTYQTNGIKWKEARGETFLWNEIRENFIKYFNFIPQNENLVETTKEIKEFIQPTENKPLKDN